MLKNCLAIGISILLTIVTPNSFAVDPDSSTKIAIDSLKKQIEEVNAKIIAGNFPADVCDQSYPPLVSAQAERNRLAKDYPYQLFDVGTGNTYTLDDLANKAGRPIIIISTEQMNAAIEAVEVAKQPCSNFSVLYDQISQLNIKLGILEQSGDGNNPNQSMCGQSLDALRTAISNQEVETKRFIGIWEDPNLIIQFSSEYSKSGTPIPDSYKILYKKSTAQLNDSITAIKNLLSQGDSQKNLEPISVCDSVRNFQTEYKSLNLSAINFMKTTKDSLDQINLNYPRYLTFFTGPITPNASNLKRVQQKIIYCLRSKVNKKVVGVNPKCPTGYKRV